MPKAGLSLVSGYSGEQLDMPKVDTSNISTYQDVSDRVNAIQVMTAGQARALIDATLQVTSSLSLMGSDLQAIRLALTHYQDADVLDYASVSLIKQGLLFAYQDAYRNGVFTDQARKALLSALGVIGTAAAVPGDATTAGQVIGPVLPQVGTALSVGLGVAAIALITVTSFVFARG